MAKLESHETLLLKSVFTIVFSAVQLLASLL